MEPTNPIQPPIPNPVSTQPVAPSQEESTVPVSGSGNKLKTTLNNLKTRFNSSPKGTKILIILITILFLIIFLLSFLVAIFGKREVAVIITPSPSPVSVTPAPQIILNASKYAKDEEVLKIENNLIEIQKQLEAVDVRQSVLAIPNPDFNINFDN